MPSKLKLLLFSLLFASLTIVCQPQPSSDDDPAESAPKPKEPEMTKAKPKAKSEGEVSAEKKDPVHPKNVKELPYLMNRTIQGEQSNPSEDAPKPEVLSKVEANVEPKETSTPTKHPKDLRIGLDGVGVGKVEERGGSVDEPKGERTKSEKEDKKVTKGAKEDQAGETVVKESADEHENRRKIEKTNEERRRQELLAASAEKDSVHAMRYLVILGVLLGLCYVCLHNRNKILGLLVEGRTSRSAGRRSATAGPNVRYRRLSQNDNNEQRNYIS